MQEAESASSFTRLAEIGLRVLATMPPPVSQLCGPISTGGFGNREANLILFERCVAELRLRGLNPFDQMPTERTLGRLAHEWGRKNPKATYCYSILFEFYDPIFASGMVGTLVFMPGWESSEGARWEREEGKRRNISIIEFPQDWYDNIMRELAPSLATR